VNYLEDALELVAIDSVSGREATLATLVAARLATAEHLDVERVGDNVVASTRGFHRQRVIVAGHLDTVPGRAEDAVIEGGRLVGLGACDMKGSLSIMLRQALDPAPRALEVTWVFYAREEISRHESGLLELAELRPDLLVAQAALLAEPTGGSVEAGCQGTLRLGVTLRGARAHTARPYSGRNAIHRMGSLISRVAAYQPREAVVDAITYTEQLQVVDVSGGVAPNVVPDEARCVLNHRVAPDRQLDDALAAVRELLGEALEPGDELEVLDWAPPAPPALEHELIARLVAATGRPARAKVGWTDVATFAERGVPAANFGAGDPLLAHRSDEFVTEGELADFDAALAAFLRA
jgi:succinyl-diaminopimelate desuccinylase